GVNRLLAATSDRFGDAARDHRRLVAEVEGQAARAQRHVGGGHAVEPSQMLDPRLVDEILEEAAGVAGVAEQLPRQRSLPQAAAAALLHDAPELAGARRVDPVL